MSSLRETLRRDGATTVTVLAALANSVFALLVVMNILLPGDRSVDRLHVLYWLTILPVVVWAYGLTAYAGWALRLVRPAFVVCPLGVVLAAACGAIDESFAIVMLVLSATASAAGLWQYQRSRLRTVFKDT